MAEPSSFTALIHMTGDSYARLMRGKTLDPLADEIARVITDGSDDVVVFKYLKQDQALFVHFCFLYNMSLDSILEHPGVSAAFAIASFKDLPVPDRAVISLDANNFESSGFSAGFIIDPSGYQRDDELDAADAEAFGALIRKYFYQLSEVFVAKGALWHGDTRVVDGKLKRKIDRHLDAHRLRVAKERVPTATPLRPVRLCDGFFYNGHVVIFKDGPTLHALPQLDPLTFRQTAYGAADAEHVVIGSKVQKTDPDRFKVLAKGETVFYAGGDHVYDRSLAVVPRADAKTFKLVHPAFARDSESWYDCLGTALPGVSNHVRIDDTLGYYWLCLLWSEQSIYLGANRLPLDVQSCELIRSQVLQQDVRLLGLFWFRDRQGDCIISLLRTDLNVRRTTTPELVWDEEKARVNPKDLTATERAWRALCHATKEGIKDDRSGRAFIASFDTWLAADFEHRWQESPHDFDLWQGINRYFECCRQAAEFRKILDLYGRVEDEAWVNPSVFHHTAYAFLAMDNPDRAVEEIRRGVIYGSRSADRLFTDPDLASLAGREGVERLKETLALFDTSGSRLARCPLPSGLLDRISRETPERLRPDSVRRVLSHFFVPNRRVRERLHAAGAIELARYERLLADFFNEATLGFYVRHNTHEHYTAWGDVPRIHPAVHMVVARDFYAEGLFWLNQAPDSSSRRYEFVWAAVAIRRAKVAVASQEKWKDDPVWQQISADATSALLVDLDQDAAAA
jgi:hypothetical protein